MRDCDGLSMLNESHRQAQGLDDWIGERWARGALVAVGSRLARKVCSCATTAAPSPMAAPTRFTEPQRTSPTAKTCGYREPDTCCVD